MMTPISLQEFDKVYQACVRAVFEHWTPEMQGQIARHCYGWSPGLFDFKSYLEASSVRFYRAYRHIQALGESFSVCDVGGFWGVLPLTLKELGYAVAMTESLKYYNDSFDALFDFIRGRGVEIFDYDPFEPDASLDKQFDVVTLMAVLEHYPHSHSTLMKNVSKLMKPGGKLYIEVPNIAYWPKRMELLKGRTPLAQIGDVYRSDVPFIGHHHEFTMAELRELARLSHMRVVAEDFYNYTPGSSPGLKMLVRRPFQFMAFLILKEARECLAVLCERDGGHE
ncbi:MAG TPA: methyltransferase domain-containing protein [Pyrinomonadaceae bacterium]|jgi:2-polyprenyl-3-methyl-5-hydroxy-6-metoxy-1,4-benzoquinol methylase